jgi:hypothetical protein
VVTDLSAPGARRIALIAHDNKSTADYMMSSPLLGAVGPAEPPRPGSARAGPAGPLI